MSDKDAAWPAWRRRDAPNLLPAWLLPAWLLPAWLLPAWLLPAWLLPAWLDAEILGKHAAQ
jgi:hypothetical protein